ncbi:MAG: type II toxin-antitoxin system HicB family antitoxin [Ktedonobacterales bacterium]
MNETEIKQQAQRYSLVVQWSDRDRVYIVSLPEWEQSGLIGHTHGATVEEAVHMGKELLDLLIEGRLADGEPLPEPRVYASAS